MDDLLENIIVTSLVAMGIGATAMVTAPRIQDKPTIYQGFEQFQDYKAVEDSIPTKGDVVRVKMLENKNYDIQIEDNTINIRGVFEYEIDPDTRFAPKNIDHSDIKGNNLQNSDYWQAQRFGRVTLKKE